MKTVVVLFIKSFATNKKTIRKFPDSPWNPCLESALECEPPPPFDPEAEKFCLGREGFYTDPGDCQSYFYCFDKGMKLKFSIVKLIQKGQHGQRMYCPPGTAWHPRLLVSTKKYISFFEVVP